MQRQPSYLDSSLIVMIMNIKWQQLDQGFKNIQNPDYKMTSPSNPLCEWIIMHQKQIDASEFCQLMSRFKH